MEITHLEIDRITEEYNCEYLELVQLGRFLKSKNREYNKTQNLDRYYTKPKRKYRFFHGSYKERKARLRQEQNAYQRNRRKIDLNFRLRAYLRSRLRHACKNFQRSGSAIRDLGCSIEKFVLWLEMHFQDGMNWNNYGKWHIDHIKPLSKFDLSDRNQLLKAVHFTNLQPLWAKDNFIKSDTWKN